MDKTGRLLLLILGLGVMFGGVVWVYNTTKPSGAPVPAAAMGMGACPSLGAQMTYQGVTYVCGPNAQWQVFGAQITPTGPAPIIPTIPAETTPLIKCPSDRKISFSVLVEDSLDEEASPQTLLDETVYIISSAGQQLDKQNTSVTSATTMSIPCTKDTVKFVTKGDDMYTTDKITVRNSEYTGATVPTYETREGVPVGFVLEPALVRAKKFGTINVTVWNDDPTAASDLYNITMAASEDSSDNLRLKVKEGTDDRAAQGIICAFNYSTSMVDKIEVEGYTGGASAVESSLIADDYSDAEDAFLLQYNGASLTLDQDARTADRSEMTYLVRIYSSSSNPAFNMTTCCYDSGTFLKASGLNIGFAHNGEWRPNDDDKVNLFMPKAAAAAGTSGEQCWTFQVL